MTTTEARPSMNRHEYPLGFLLYRSSFPGDRGRLPADARRAGAPKDVIDRRTHVPPPPQQFGAVSHVEHALDQAPDLDPE